MIVKKSAVKSKLRVVLFGVIGVGGMGSSHCDTIVTKVPGARLTAVCDGDPATAKRVGERFKVAHFSSYKDLIKSGLCDAVILATPHPTHAPIGIECMNAGIHLLCEKPLSETIGRAEEMVRTARKNKVALSVMFQRRFEPAFRKAIELARKGEIGRIIRVTLISPEYRSQAYYNSGTWRATWAGEGGGIMMNQASHIMDIFVHIIGLPQSVRGFVDTRMHRIEVEDVAEAFLKLKDGGSGFLYCSTNEPGPGQMIEVCGDKGKLICRDGQLTFRKFDVPVRRFTKINTEMWASPPAHDVPLKISQESTAHRNVIRNFVGHLLRNEPLVCSGESALASLELANAITLSSYTGKEVELPISRKAYDRLLAKLRAESKFKKGKVSAKRTTDPRHLK